MYIVLYVLLHNMFIHLQCICISTLVAVNRDRKRGDGTRFSQSIRAYFKYQVLSICIWKVIQQDVLGEGDNNHGLWFFFR